MSASAGDSRRRQRGEEAPRTRLVDNRLDTAPSHEGTESRDGRWATGRAPDGHGEFEYLAHPEPLGEEPELGAVDPRLHGTAKFRMPTTA